jgi:hypothetical protein
MVDLNKYLAEKYGLDLQEAEKQYQDQASSINTANLFSNLGDVIAGNRVGSNNATFQQLNKQAMESTVGKVKGQKDQAIADYDLNKKLKSDAADQEKAARENDVNSPESKVAQSLAVELGLNPEMAKGLTASKWKQFSPAYEKMYEARNKREENSLKRQELGQRKQELQDLRIQEKQNQLQTPFGVAQTPDDAKQLKAASEEKSNFDRKIQELIDLRTDKGGGAIMDREAVARGKQLSKDLLLAYKNMAKLGVLSQSDEAIINAIIPADPLEYNSPLAAMQGQDPILNNLKKFKADSDADFQQKLMNRLRQPDQAVQKANTPQTKEINGQMYEKVNGGWQKVKKDAGL